MNIKNNQKILSAVEISDVNGTIEKHYSGSEDALLLKAAETEFNLLKSINCDSLISPLDFYFDLQNRRAVIQFTPFESDRFNVFSQENLISKLELMITLCQELEGLHKKGIALTGLHKDSLFLGKSPKSLKLLNVFSISAINSPISDLDHAYYAQNCPYSAPELIGKIAINTLDHRTDYYAVGVILYELLTGFEFTHDSNYTPQLNTESLQPIFSAIISKLTNRMPQHRYQSAHGIYEDLASCLSQLRASGKIKYFLPGLQDRPERFIFKDHLYGRRVEVQSLSKTYTEVMNEQTIHLTFLKGEPGIGKTATVRYFLNQLKKTTPCPLVATGKSDEIFATHHSVIAQVLRDLFGYIQNDLSKNWKELVNERLYPYGKLIVSLIPEMDHFFSSQPLVPSMEPIKEKQRFNYLLTQFFQLIIVETGLPIIIFIDDFQWADSLTLDFIKFLAVSGNMPIYIIGTYRPMEGGQNNYLQTFISDFKEQNNFSEISIEGLSENDVAQQIQDLFQNTATQECLSLATEAYKRTYGNPFFLKQFFLNGWEQKNIVFEPHTKKWCWNLDKIRSVKLDSTMADLVIERIRLLPLATQEILKIASIMGHQFNLEDLSLILDKDPFNVSLELWPALQEDFVFETTSRELSSVENDGGCQNFNYTFLHDKIQSAFYTLIEKETLSQLHYMIAKKLISKKSSPAFEIANHLISAKDHLKTEQEKREAIALCYKVGTHAQQSSAFEAALKHFKFCSELSQDITNDIDTQTNFLIQLALAEMEYLCGYFDDSIAHFESAKLTPLSLFDKALLERKTISLYTNMANYKQAILTGLSLLKQLGVVIPEKPLKVQILANLFKAKLAIRNKVDLLSELSVIDDEKKLETTRVIAQLLAPAYFSNLPLFSYLISTLVYISAKYGHSPCASFGYISFASILASSLNEFDLSVRLGNQAIKIQEKEGNPDTDAKLHYMYGAFVGRWRLPLNDCLPYLNTAHQFGLKNGDINFINYAIATSLFMMIAKGDNLHHTLEKIDADLPFVQKMKYIGVYYDLIIAKLFISNLMTPTETPTSFNCTDFIEAEEVKFLRSGKHITSDGWYHVVKLQLLYLFEEYATAEIIGFESDRILSYSYGLIQVQEHYFYFTLTLIKNSDCKESWGQRFKRNQKIKKNMRKLQKWAEACPENYGHKYCLVLGEFYRSKNDLQKAEYFFKEGIDLAQKNKFNQVVALGFELLWKSNMMYDDALKNAYSWYLKWGANTKAEHLRYNHKEIFREESF